MCMVFSLHGDIPVTTSLPTRTSHCPLGQLTVHDDVTAHYGNVTAHYDDVNAHYGKVTVQYK